MADNNKESILKKELQLPRIPFAERIPHSLPGWAAFGCALLCVLFPLVVCVFALTKGSIDYPVIFGREWTLRWVNPIVFYTGIVALILALLHRHNGGCGLRATLRHNPVLIFFAAMALWILAATFANDFNYTAMYGTEAVGESIFVQMAYLVLFFPLCALITRLEHKAIVLRVFLFVSAFLSVSAFFLWKTQQTSIFVTGWRPAFTCIFVNTNYFGYYLTVGVSLAAAMTALEKHPLWRGFALLCLAVNSVALCFNNTMGAWVGSVGACLFLLVAGRIRDGKWNGWSLAALGILVLCLILPGKLPLEGLVPVTDNANKNITQLTTDIGKIVNEPTADTTLRAGSGRWKIWLRSMELIGENPVFGIGFEGVMVRGLEKYVGNNRPHNEYMQYALFYGIPALILYVAGCLCVYLRALRRRARLDDVTLAALTAAFGYLVGAFFGLTTYNTTPFLFLFLALGYVRGESPSLPSPRGEGGTAKP